MNIVSSVNPVFRHGEINVWDFVAEKKPELMQSMMNVKNGLAKTIYARKCNVIQIDKNKAKTFLDACHVKGFTPASWYFALQLNAEVVMVLSVSPSRFHVDYDMEIIRLASALNTVVVGGASKLLKFAQTSLNTNSFYTYSENMLGDGQVYDKCGFKFIEETPKGYFWKNGETIYSRYQTQKPRLFSIFQDLTEQEFSNSSEAQIMTRRGFIKVQDIGNKRWGMNPQSSSHKFHYTYKITRPNIDDSYYYGVHSTNNVDDGYLGSGLIICRSIQKYGVEQHHKEILKFYDTRTEAFEAEAELVNDACISDPRCLNLVRGGKQSINFNSSGMIVVHHPDRSNYILINKNEKDVYLSQGFKLGKTDQFKNAKHMSDGTQTKIVKSNEVQKFLDQGWFFVSRNVKTKHGKIELIKDGQTKCFDEEDAYTKIVNDGWELKRKQLKSAPDQVIRLAKRLGMRVPSTKLDDGYINPPKPKNKNGAATGKFSINKDGVRKFVSAQDAIKMVKFDGWELGAASCWRLASDAAKQLGIEIGYDVANNQTRFNK